VQDEPFFKQMELGPMMNFIYLLGSRSQGEAAVVDPGWEPDAIVSAAEAEGLKLTKVLLTHCHQDHILSLGALLSRVNVPVYVNKYEAPYIQRITSDVVAVDDGDDIEVGHLTVRCLHTPGHSRGSQCFTVDSILFSGDTLFVGSCGRCDLPDSSPEDLYNSLQLLAKMDGSILVLPGHNYGPRPTTTIEDERRYNPYLRIPTLDVWLRMMGYP
jgi:hydroxyacylglutathione hydrolase